jgi:hypothetical protein
MHTSSVLRVASARGFHDLFTEASLKLKRAETEILQLQEQSLHPALSNTCAKILLKGTTVHYENRTVRTAVKLR